MANIREIEANADLAETYAIGHLAHQEAYTPDHIPVPGPAYRLALQYGAGLLSPDSEAANDFLVERDIYLEVSYNALDPHGSYYRVQAVTSDNELVFDQALRPIELAASVPS